MIIICTGMIGKTLIRSDDHTEHFIYRVCQQNKSPDIFTALIIKRKTWYYCTIICHNVRALHKALDNFVNFQPASFTDDINEAGRRSPMVYSTSDIYKI